MKRLFTLCDHHYFPSHPLCMRFFIHSIVALRLSYTKLCALWLLSIMVTTERNGSRLNEDVRPAQKSIDYLKVRLNQKDAATPMVRISLFARGRSISSVRTWIDGLIFGGYLFLFSFLLAIGGKKRGVKTKGRFLSDHSGTAHMDIFYSRQSHCVYHHFVPCCALLISSSCIYYA